MDIKVSNKELIRRILERLQKPEDSDISDEDLKSIDKIAFVQYLDNGKESGIKIEDVFLFENLKCLTLKGFTLNLEDIQKIAQKQSIEQIAFLGCTFNDVDFEKVSRIPETLRFGYCMQMPVKFPKQKQIIIGACDIDFDSIDFESASIINILDSRIINAKDLNEFKNLEEVYLDGSVLLGRDGKPLEEIKVAENCFYSHEKEDFKYEKETQTKVVKENKNEENLANKLEDEGKEI